MCIAENFATVIIVELYQDSRFNSKEETMSHGRGLYDFILASG
jgi:hypothetical protein